MQVLKSQQFWRSVLIACLTAAIPLFILELIGRLDMLVCLAIAGSSGIAVAVATLVNMRELEGGRRWLESLSTGDERGMSGELGEAVATRIAPAALGIQRARLRAERQAGREQQNFRELLGIIADPVLLIGSDDTIMDANDAARRSFSQLGHSTPISRLFRDPGLLQALTAARDMRQTSQLAFTPAASPERRFGARLASVALPDGGPGVLLLLREEGEQVMIERMRSDFIANVSHELRTPLASISGFIETLQGPARNDTDARINFLEIMAGEAVRMRRLVDDLLSLSRIEVASSQPPDEPCDVDELIGEVIARLRPVADAARVQLVRERGRDLPVILADHDQLYQALVNLIENAIKYGGQQKAVRIHARAHTRAPAQAGPLAGSRALEISVIDEGPGVASEHLARLTERFYRVDKARSRSVGGTGLGLAIVKHIVRRHQGHLAIASVIGEGSCFSIYLPDRDIPVADDPPPGRERLQART